MANMITLTSDKLANIIKITQAVHDMELEIEYETPAYTEFPYELSWRGQNEAIKSILDHEDKVILESHTGAGKSIVFLTAARASGLRSVVIEPRKFLESQIASYDIPTKLIFGRNAYKCDYAESADMAPCLVTYEREITDEEGNYQRERVFDLFDENSGKIMPHHYPCGNCPYFNASVAAQSALTRNSAILITNSGNFRKYISMADFVIADEVDELFRLIAKGKYLRYVKKLDDKPIRELLLTEHYEISHELKEITSSREYISPSIASTIRKLKGELETTDFLIQNADVCFAYQRKRDNRIFVEVQPTEFELILDRVFQGKKVCLVTATPPITKNAITRIDYTIPSRAVIFYMGIAKMTSRNLYTLNRQWLFSDIYDIISIIFKIFKQRFGIQKAVIHAGNLDNHAALLNDRLKEQYKTTVHTRGHLMETLETFMHTDSNFCLVTSAEFGWDVPPEISLQFVLKFPYMPRNERLLALEKTIGREEFKKFYEYDAMSRLIQGSGRVGRGTSFGATFILDTKFGEIYEKYLPVMPKWFVDRLINTDNL